MSGVIQILAPVFGLIAFGAITAKRNWLGAQATDVLNRFVVRLALPAVLFRITVQVPLAQLNHPDFVSAYGIGMTLTFALAWCLCWRRERAHAHRLSSSAIEGLAAGYANTSFIGIPICLSVFGPQAMAAVTLSTLLTVCALFAVAIFMIEADQQAQGHPGAALAKVLRALALNPLVFAPAAGLALNLMHVPMPAAATTFVTLLGQAATPCALLTIGMFLAESSSLTAAQLPVVLRLTALKMLLQPALTLLLAAKVFSMQSVWVREAFLLSALPTGTGPFMLARLYRREAGIASQVTLLTTVLSLVTIGAILAWMGGHAG